MEKDKQYMRRCLELASRGLGNTSPNPAVGCVIVHNNKIIGEGFHLRAGEPHAEVNALNSVKNPKLLREATLYVNLEPCSHKGKTGPCADLIVKKKLKRVVTGMRDPHEKVAGRGIKKLRKGGIEVTEGVLEQECRSLNAPFITYHTKNRPHVILKWAQSPDGYTDLPRSASNKYPTAITGKFTRLFTHKLRSRFDAIMIGTKTAAMDDPSLNARFWDNRDPVRAVIDEHLILSGLKLFTDGGKTLVFNASENRKKGSVEYIKTSFDHRLLHNILRELHKREILSVLVEGGSTLHSGFIEYDLWDEAYRYTSSQTLKSGVKAPDFKGVLQSRHVLDRDLVEYFHPE